MADKVSKTGRKTSYQLDSKYFYFCTVSIVLSELSKLSEITCPEHIPKSGSQFRGQDMRKNKEIERFRRLCFSRNFAKVRQNRTCTGRGRRYVLCGVRHEAGLEML
ncbi:MULTISPECIES: hypothetical protein [unclassified Brucella]|uniref:hypothetical protein n=1 Tax=unclassified Brucella TaxID=2632610 RepID=UPI00217CD9A9|nr:MULTISPECIES: hypothetical protein [unclassified Brucella]UWF66835.1 hypothetical protein NYO63_01325 [Brucella sp. 1315]UWF69960.1 hypothetical protein NYO65_01325 [Brucella sp. 2594]